MKFSKVALALGTLMAATAISACGSSDSPAAPVASATTFPQGSKMAEIASAKSLQVGVQTTYPLIGQQTFDGYDGFDVRIAENIAAHLGLDKKAIEFVPVTTATREAFLEQDKVDIVVAAYSINAEREKVVDFAGPYLESPAVLLVPAGNPKGIQKLEDMSGKTLCTASGSSMEAYIKANHPEVAAGLKLFDSSAKCRDAVMNGQVDASTTEKAILASFVAQNKDKLELVDDPYLAGFYGIGVAQKDNKDFCTWVNGTLETMYKDGSWATAYDETLGTVLGDAPEPPAIRACGNAAG